MYAMHNSPLPSFPLAVPTISGSLRPAAACLRVSFKFQFAQLATHFDSTPMMIFVSIHLKVQTPLPEVRQYLELAKVWTNRDTAGTGASEVYMTIIGPDTV